jgi:hypothetical protein
MTQLRIKFTGDQQLGPKFKRNRVRDGELVLSAVRQAAQAAQTELLTKGRADIARAGRFGSRWTEGLTAPITEGGGRIVLNLSHSVPYFMVFQRGKVIRGKPLLWIPLSFAGIAPGLRARDFPGGLFRVNRAGKAPLLLAFSDKKPKYFGKASVTIPKKFHVLEIGREVARKFKDLYRAKFHALKRQAGMS